MPTNDLSNKQQLLLDYMKAMLKQQFPSLDISNNGAFMETFGFPHLKLLEPIVNMAERISLMQSLENAASLTIDEMNQLGAKYNMIRKAGKQTTGYATLVFRDIPPTNVLEIPVSQIGLSRQGYKFVSTTTVRIDATRLGDYYDTNTFRFRIPVPFQADLVGAVYNIKAGEFARLQSTLPYLESVVNELDFTGGTDQETNVEFAARIKQGALAPTLGTNRGYMRFIKDNFTAVQDLLVAGYGHPLMQRDIVGTIPSSRFNPIVSNVHWGTKIDIYTRGRTLVTFTENLTVRAVPNTTNQFGVLLTKVPVYDVQQASFVTTDPSVNPITLIITSFALLKDGNLETMGTVYEQAFAVLNDSRAILGAQVQVTYRYNSLPQDITTAMYTSDNRPPTADVRIKEAPTRYVFGGLLVKPVSSLRLKETDKSAIRQLAYNSISSIKMGGELQFSNVTTAILNMNSSSRIVSYIHMPAKFLAFSHNEKYIYYCLGTATRTYLASIAAINPFMQDAINGYKDKITSYDFFDVLHLLSYENGLETALAALGNQSADLLTQTQWYGWARGMALRGGMLALLSPATYTLKEHQYFDIGQFSIYEEKPYLTSDWGNLLALFQTLANVTVNTAQLNVLHLTVYCLSIIYLMTHLEIVSGSVTPFLSYFRNVTSSTPIQGQFML